MARETDLYDSTYGHFADRVLAAVRVETYGTDIGQNSWTTKDPDRIQHGRESTPSSPNALSDAFLLGRYLDYCSELLALIAKVGALYAQSFDDPVAIAAVDEIEDLTNGLARKIWQKLIILDRIVARTSPANPGPL